MTDNRDTTNLGTHGFLQESRDTIPETTFEPDVVSEGAMARTEAQTTVFADSGVVYREIDPSAEDTLHTETVVAAELGLKQYLSIPYLIQQMSWTTNYGTLPLSFFPIDALFQIPALWARLRYYKYVHFDLEISVKVNGSSMHYGEMMLVHTPLPQGLTNVYAHNGKESAAPVTNGYTCTSRQHVVFGPSAMETNSMTLGFALPDLYLDTEKPAWSINWSIMNLWVINPLRIVTGTANAVDVSIFANLKNISLMGYHAAPADDYVPLTLQQKLNLYGMFIWPEDVFGRVSLLQDIIFPATSNDDAEGWEPQVGRAQIKQGLVKTGEVSGAIRSAIKPENEKEIKQEKGTFSSVGKVVDSVASIVGTIASVASVAAAFLDKPPTEQIPQRVFISQDQPNYMTGMDCSYNLSALPDNRVKRLPQKHVDKMDSLAAIAGTYGLLEKNITITTSTVGTFWHHRVHPMNTSVCQNVSGVNVTNPALYLLNTPASFVSSLFEFWRGTMVYKFEFIASKFHSTRIRISFDPGDYFTNIPETDYRISDRLNKVLDINGNTSVEIDIPFTARDPAYPTAFFSRSVFPTTLSATNHVVGNVSLSIVNTLTAGIDGPPNAIACNVYIKMKDAQWYMPTSRFMTVFPVNEIKDIPVAPSPKKEDDSYNSVSDDVPQALFRDTPKSQNDEKPTPSDSALTLRNGIVPYRAAFLNGLIAGEEITRISQIVSRYGYFGKFTVDTSVLLKWPYMKSGYFTDACPNDFCAMAYVSQAFRGARGSVNFRLLADNPFDFVTLAFPSSIMNEKDEAPVENTTTTYATCQQRFNMGAVFVPSSRQTLPSFRLPYYSNLKWIPLDYYDVSGTETTPYGDFSIPVLELVCYHSNAGFLGSQVTIHASAGDDFEFVHFLGAPCTVVSIKAHTSRSPFWENTWP